MDLITHQINHVDDLHNHHLSSSSTIASTLSLVIGSVEGGKKRLPILLCLLVPSSKAISTLYTIHLIFLLCKLHLFYIVIGNSQEKVQIAYEMSAPNSFEGQLNFHALALGNREVGRKNLYSLWPAMNSTLTEIAVLFVQKT